MVGKLNFFRFSACSALAVLAWPHGFASTVHAPLEHHWSIAVIQKLILSHRMFFKSYCFFGTGKKVSFFVNIPVKIRRPQEATLFLHVK